jgi:hypothetical protein
MVSSSFGQQEKKLLERQGREMTGIREIMGKLRRWNCRRSEANPNVTF